MPQNLDPKAVLIYHPHPVVCEEIRKLNFIAVRRIWASTQAMVVHHGAMEAPPEH
jgi:hypothetical protein